MVVINYSGRLGNNMFQYAYGRILSDDYNLSLISTDINTNGEHINLHDYFENCCMNISRKVSKNLISIQDVLTERIGGDHGFNLNGFFQHAWIYEQNKSKIKDWFYLDDHFLKKEITVDDIVLHIRRGDYKDCKYSNIRWDYYTNILDKQNKGRVFIVTDEVDEVLKKYFQIYNPIYVSSKVDIEDMKFIKCFNKIVMANSTFSWWSAFLSDAEEIYYPSPKDSRSFFHESLCNQRLYLPNFIKVEDVATY